MEDERSLAKKDRILKKLASECKFEGDIYSSDEELDFPYGGDDISDDIDEVLFREQIRGAKKFFQEVTGVDDDDDDDDDADEVTDLFDEVLETGSNPLEVITLKPTVKYTDTLSNIEMAMERNSKMRDLLLSLEQALLNKKQEYEDMISALEAKDDVLIEDHTEHDEDNTVSWGFPGFLKDVVFTNKSTIFLNQFSHPYFKDKDNFYCPPNRDSISQEKLFTIRVSSIEPNKHWTSQSIDNLELAIKKSLVEEFKSRADFKAIYQWREYSSFVKKHSLFEILSAKSPDFKLDWLKIAALLPQEESRTSTECSKLWDLYLSPKFSKENWTTAEDDEITALAKKYNEQDWDCIADKLSTNRSPFQIFSYYQSSLRNRIHFGERWTAEEDEYLKTVINCCTYGNFIYWKKVMYYCERRTYVQAYNRWKNNLACKKKGKFSISEDRALITAMAHGMGYRDTAKALRGQRTQQQIRERLLGIVKFGRDNALNIGDWSAREDTKLLDLIKKHGENYSAIASELGTRDRTQCRHRFRRLKKHLENPDFTIAQLQRRRRRGRYSTKIRCRKKNLMKLLTSGPLPKKRKRQFVSEIQNILDDDNEHYEILESNLTAAVAQKFNPIVERLSERGSGFWTRFDLPKTSEIETQFARDCCEILDTKFKYDLWVDNDEHLKSVEQLFLYFKKNGVCNAADNSPNLSEASSSNTSSQRLSLIPPNFYSCSGFLNILSYCSAKEKVKVKKKKTDALDENEEIKRAKELFRQRLLQLFLWPAILTNKQMKNKLNTYGNKAIKFKAPNHIPYN